jgi:hypothetical protein
MIIKILITAFLMALILFQDADCAAAKNKLDKNLMFLPSYGYHLNGKCQFAVRAWCFEPEKDSKKRRVLLKLMISALSLSDDAEKSSIFCNRAS